MVRGGACSTTILAEVKALPHIKANEIPIKISSNIASPNNFFDLALIRDMADCFDELDEDSNCRTIVLCSNGKHFCAGANLNLILNSAYRKDWDELNRTVMIMQDVLQSLRYAEFTVVSAPFGLVLGGGFEVIGACDRIIAAGESYIGLVEVGVGLIPGAGGNLRMISNLSKKIKSANYSIDTYKKKIYIYGISETKDEREEVIKEAKEILDVEDVIASILLVEDLRIQKN